MGIVLSDYVARFLVNLGTVPAAGLQDNDAEAALGDVAGKRSAAGAGSYYDEVIRGALFSRVRRGSSHKIVKRLQLAGGGPLSAAAALRRKRG